MDIKSLSDNDLILLRAQTEAEMILRGIASSVGDIGELLVIKYFNSTKGLPTLQAVPTGTKNVDAISRDGDRYSIKTRLKATKTSAIYLDKDSPEKQLFEYILLVKIDNNYNLQSIHQYDWNQFFHIKSWDKRMSAWYLSCSIKTLSKGKQLL